MELKKSLVVFNEEKHEYWLGDKQLNGITGMIGRQIFGGAKYDGVPQAIMERARAKGTLVHKEIEDWCKSGENGFTDELQDFIALKEQLGFEVLANEFTVDDGDYFATNIDLVLLSGNKVELCDIKTTYALDQEYLSWQLSINAVLFEKQTGVEVDVLSSFWKGKRILIDRKPNELVMELLNAEKAGKSFQVTTALDNVSTDKYMLLQTAIKSLKQQLEELEEQEQTFKADFMAKMKEHNIKTLDLEFVKITYVAPTTKQTLDGKALKEQLPKIYEQFVKESDVKESLRITVKKEK